MSFPFLSDGLLTVVTYSWQRRLDSVIFPRKVLDGFRDAVGFLAGHLPASLGCLRRSRRPQTRVVWLPGVGETLRYLRPPAPRWSCSPCASCPAVPSCQRLGPRLLAGTFWPSCRVFCVTSLTERLHLTRGLWHDQDSSPPFFLCFNDTWPMGGGGVLPRNQLLVF